MDSGRMIEMAMVQKDPSDRWWENQCLRFVSTGR